MPQMCLPIFPSGVTHITPDYWVNAMDGQPFFVISKDVDPGLLQVLENDLSIITDVLLPDFQHFITDGTSAECDRLLAFY